LEYQVLGRSELTVSRVGLGCWAIGGHGWGPVDDSESLGAIRRALDLGINFFDTADVYGLGHSEEVLSRALGEERKRVVIATKFGVRIGENGRSYRDLSPDWLSKALEHSLRRLRLDCIPLYQIHHPASGISMEGTLEALDRYKDQGKIRYIGCSNFSVEELRLAQKGHRLESLQVAYNLVDRGIERDLLPYSKGLKMGVIAYSPLAQGLLSGKFDEKTKFSEDDMRSRSKYFADGNLEANLRVVRELRQIAQSLGKTPAQVAIRWLIEHPSVASAIPGVKTARQVEENVGGVGWSLGRELRERLELGATFSSSPVSAPRSFT